MTLFQNETGPLMRYSNGIFYVEDLNPQMQTRWRMGRWEMLKLGFLCIAAAIKALDQNNVR